MNSNDNEFITDNEVTDNVVDRDEDFLPSTPEHIEEFNIEISTSFLASVSPLKRKNLIREKSIENYVKKKKKIYFQHCLILDVNLDVKLNNVYDVSITANGSTVCHCTEWIQNLGLALQKCSTVSEKIKILTLLPSSLTRNEISSLFPDITIYMIEWAKNLAQEKGVYSEPEAYTGHPIDERAEKIVMEYYINDDFNCSSPNKSDVITVKINDFSKINISILTVILAIYKH